jgi:hypothetical protein
MKLLPQVLTLLEVIESWCQKELAKQPPNDYSLWLENFMGAVEALRIQVEDAEKRFS